MDKIKSSDSDLPIKNPDQQITTDIIICNYPKFPGTIRISGTDRAKYMSEITLNEQNFDQEVTNSQLPVMVDFWAVWCGPCKVLSPIVAELANEYQGKLKVGKVNVDENNGLAFRFNVMSLPTLKFFKNGKIVGELIGAAPKATIEAELKKYL